MLTPLLRHKSLLHARDFDSEAFVKNVLTHLPMESCKLDGCGRERQGETYITVDRLLNEVISHCERQEKEIFSLHMQKSMS